MHGKDGVRIRFLTQEEALFRKCDLNCGWVLVFTVIHLTACILSFTLAQTQGHDGPCVVETITISRAASVWHVHVSVLCLCMRLCASKCVSAGICMRLVLQALSTQWSNPPAESHAAMGASRKRGRRKRIFLSFPFLFIFFDSSLDISATLFLKLHNTLLEVWVEGKGRQRGWRQDTDLNCDDSLGFLPLTSSTLLRGGESVATERNLKDSGEFRHCHKHGLPRGMWVNKRALWTVHFIHTYIERFTLAWVCFLLLYVLLPCSLSHSHSYGENKREKASDSFISPLNALLYMLRGYVLRRKWESAMMITSLQSQKGSSCGNCSLPCLMT